MLYPLWTVHHAPAPCMLWEPFLDMVDYLQVPSDLLRNPRNIILSMVGVPGTHTQLYAIFLVERCCGCYGPVAGWLWLGVMP